MSTYLSPAFYLANILVVIILLFIVFDGQNMRRNLGLFIVCFAVSLFKIYLIAQTTNWNDVPLDSFTYIEFSQIFTESLWRGEDIGISPGQCYAGFFGTYEWFYSFYLSMWEAISANSFLWALYANAIFVAASAVASYCLSLRLGFSLKTSVLALVFFMLDPTIGINSAFLLKDSIALFATIVSISSAYNCISRQRKVLNLFLFLFLMAILFMTKMISFVAIFIALCMLLIYKMYKNLKKEVFTMFCLCSVSVLAMALAANAPLYNFNLKHVKSLVLQQKQVLSGQSDFLQQKQVLSGQSDSKATCEIDSAVASHRNFLIENPYLALPRAMIRTLLAPYPWLLLNYEGRVYVELYCFGSLFLIFIWPGFFVGILKGEAQRNTGRIFVSLFSFIIMIFYIVYFGELSTRQRGILLPFLYIIAAAGYSSERTSKLKEN